MPPVPLKRVDEPRIEGIEYNGDNTSEIIRFFNPRSGAAIVDPSTMEITFRDRHGGVDEVKVGDWIVSEDRRTSVCPRAIFNRRYVARPPAGHKVVSAETGKEITWDDNTH